MVQGLFPGGGKILGEAAKKTLLAAITIPEGIIMLGVAVLLDVIGLMVLILSFVGVGIPLSFLLDFAGIITVGSWLFIRPFFRPLVKGVLTKATEKIGKQIEKMPTFGERKKTAPPPGAQVAKKVGKTGIKAGKTGIKLGLGGLATIGTIIIELIPFLGDIAPTWTLRVVYELIQGEL